MKKYFMFFLVSFILIGCASTQPIKEPDPTIVKVVEVPNFTKDQIYDQTKIYIAENFRSAKAVLEYENKESGTIIGNGNMKYPATGFEAMALSDWRANYTMRVDIKDGRYRCTFSNLRVSWPASYNKTVGAQSAGERPIRDQRELDMFKGVLLKIPDDIYAYITKSTKKDNW
jgi:hypothetical protein